jgi:hypothetical protein
VTLTLDITTLNADIRPTPIIKAPAVTATRPGLSRALALANRAGTPSNRIGGGVMRRSATVASGAPTTVVSGPTKSGEAMRTPRNATVPPSTTRMAPVWGSGSR